MSSAEGSAEEARFHEVVDEKLRGLLQDCGVTTKEVQVLAVET
jgi:hypothetical protein